jgi:Flp pilus assembly protein TadG
MTFRVQTYLGERDERSGYVLITMALSCIALFGMLGLALDLGHAFIARNEAQAFTDSAASAAALRLDGSSSGVANADWEVNNSAAPANANAWNLSTAAFTNTQLEFGLTQNGPWVNTATASLVPAGYAFTRVTTTVTLPLYILPVVVSATSMPVIARSVAGQVPGTPKGFPYSPMGHDPADTIDYGLIAGTQYTLRWGAGFKNGCAGDQVIDPVTGLGWNKTAANRSGSADARGFYANSSASMIGYEIVDDYNVPVYSPGQDVNLTGGDKETDASNAVVTRIQQDSFQGMVTGITITNPVGDYTGNGRRIVAVPVSDPHNGNAVLGYRAFMLLNTGAYQGGGGNTDYCAVYLGSFNEGSKTRSAMTGASYYKTRLVQ